MMTHDDDAGSSVWIMAESMSSTAVTTVHAPSTVWIPHSASCTLHTVQCTMSLCQMQPLQCAPGCSLTLRNLITNLVSPSQVPWRPFIQCHQVIKHAGPTWVFPIWGRGGRGRYYFHRRKICWYKKKKQHQRWMGCTGRDWISERPS